MSIEKLHAIQFYTGSHELHNVTFLHLGLTHFDSTLYAKLSDSTSNMLLPPPKFNIDLNMYGTFYSGMNGIHCRSK